MSRSPTKFLESPMFTYEPTYNINEQLQFDRRPAAIYQDFNATADHEVWRILDNDNPNCTQFSKHIVDSHTLNKARSPTVRRELFNIFLTLNYSNRNFETNSTALN